MSTSHGFKKFLFFFKKTLDNRFFMLYNLFKFEYHKNNYDEDGRRAELKESWRLLQANSKTFQ